jgi:Novel STAND NTPase 1
MVSAGSSWRVATMRPGEDPTYRLAAALDRPQVLGIGGELASTNRVLLDATLRRGTRGLVEVVRQARIPREDNLLVVVDQFEELFRFRSSRLIENSRDEAVAFVKLLLEAAHQDEVPIYVVLTMRSDFIGDCMDFPALPEAVNAGQYLVPRMTRDELRSAIMGPVAVGDGSITQRLVLRLLNDFGEERDQLPVLQHALMRTWNYWERHRQPDHAIDIEDYEAIGTLRYALSMHAEEAYEEASRDHRGKDV